MTVTVWPVVVKFIVRLVIPADMLSQTHISCALPSPAFVDRDLLVKVSPPSVMLVAVSAEAVLKANATITEFPAVVEGIVTVAPLEVMSVLVDEFARLIVAEAGKAHSRNKPIGIILFIGLPHFHALAR